MITAIALVALVLIHIKDNIVNFRVIYLAEAAVDAVIAYILVFNKDVKEYFGQND